jgi:histidine triad (HIT) family protein
MPSRPAAQGCIFCSIVRGETEAARVYEDELTVAFLDHRPLLPGHCLLVPRTHVETLPELPDGLVASLFGTARLLCQAVEKGMEGAGSFVAINNKISQSVPHLHVHVVPRWPKDGLFSTRMIWKRSPYKDEAERRAAQARIRRAIEEITGEEP